MSDGSDGAGGVGGSDSGGHDTSASTDSLGGLADSVSEAVSDLADAVSTRARSAMRCRDWPTRSESMRRTCRASSARRSWAPSPAACRAR